MIGTTGGAILAAVSLVFAGLLGVGAGGFGCLVLRLRWSFKDAAIDAGVAALVFITGAFIDTTIASARGVWQSHEATILFVAANSAAARELIRLTRR
jgi:hypothetical protein